MTGSVSRAGAGAIRIGSAVGAAMTSHRVLGPAEAKIMMAAAILLFCVAAIFIIWPRYVAIPIAVVVTWLAISLAIRAHRLYVRRRREEDAFEDPGAIDSVTDNKEKRQGRAEARP